LLRLRSGASHPGTSPTTAWLLLAWHLDLGLQQSLSTAKRMQNEWKKANSDGQLAKFTYAELPDGKVLTAQIAGHELVCSVISQQPEHPYSREGVESHFAQGTNFRARLRSR